MFGQKRRKGLKKLCNFSAMSHEDQNIMCVRCVKDAGNEWSKYPVKRHTYPLPYMLGQDKQEILDEKSSSQEIHGRCCVWMPGQSANK